jgi:hypothetical protein
MMLRAMMRILTIHVMTNELFGGLLVQALNLPQLIEIDIAASRILMIREHRIDGLRKFSGR